MQRSVGDRGLRNRPPTDSPIEPGEPTTEMASSPARHRLTSPALVAVTALAVLGAAPVDALRPPEDRSSTDTLTLGTVLDRHAAAMGGGAALDSLRNLDVRFLVVEPTFALEGRYRGTRDGRVRVDVYAGDENVYSEGIDSAGAWKREGPGEAVQPLSSEGESALRHGIVFNLVPLHEFPRHGHELDHSGREEVDDASYHVIDATLRDGFETRFYIDPESWLVTRRRDLRALHPDWDSAETRLETVFHEFEEVCGVRRATRTAQIELATGDTVQTTRVIEQRCNLPPDSLDLSRTAGKEPPAEAGWVPAPLSGHVFEVGHEMNGHAERHAAFVPDILLGR